MANLSFGRYWEWMGTDLELSGNKLLIYSYLFGFCHESENGTCHPSQETIGKMFHLNRASVQRVLNSLKEDGLIGWECGRFEHKSNVYFVLPEPLWKIAEKYPDLTIVTPGIAQHSRQKENEDSSSMHSDDTAVVSEREKEKRPDLSIIPSREQITDYVKESYPGFENYIASIESLFKKKSNNPYWLNLGISWKNEIDGYLKANACSFNQGDQINGRTL